MSSHASTRLNSDKHPLMNERAWKLDAEAQVPKLSNLWPST